MTIQRCFVVALVVFLVGGCSPERTTQGESIGPEGGTVTSSDQRVTLTFPKGAVQQEIFVTITRHTDYPSDPAVLPLTVYDFGPDGTKFKLPVRATVKYEKANIPAGTADQLSLQKLESNGWVPLENQAVDQASSTVSADLSGFSIYGVRTFATRALDIAKRVVGYWRVDLPACADYKEFDNDKNLLYGNDFCVYYQKHNSPDETRIWLCAQLCEMASFYLDPSGWGVGDTITRVHRVETFWKDGTPTTITQTPVSKVWGRSYFYWYLERTAADSDFILVLTGTLPRDCPKGVARIDNHWAPVDSCHKDLFVGGPGSIRYHHFLITKGLENITSKLEATITPGDYRVIGSGGWQFPESVSAKQYDCKPTQISATKSTQCKGQGPIVYPPK